jgi:hypothetical protein
VTHAKAANAQDLTKMHGAQGQATEQLERLDEVSYSALAMVIVKRLRRHQATMRAVVSNAAIQLKPGVSAKKPAAYR